MQTMKQFGPGRSLGNNGYYVFTLVVKMGIMKFWVKFDLEGQGQSLPKTIGILTKVFCTSGPNLVILALTGSFKFRVDKLTLRRRLQQYLKAKSKALARNPTGLT